MKSDRAQQAMIKVYVARCERAWSKILSCLIVRVLNPKLLLLPIVKLINIIKHLQWLN